MIANVDLTENFLRTIAAGIDLNQVRARMVTDPADYHYSSYGEVASGVTNAKARKRG